jgi:hypothetical protein
VLDGRRWQRLYLFPDEPRLVTRTSLGLRTSRPIGLGGMGLKPSEMRGTRWLALLDTGDLRIRSVDQDRHGLGD